MKDSATETRTLPSSKMTEGRWDRVARTLFVLLASDDENAWIESQNYMARNLTETELASIAYTMLRALPDEICHEVANEAIYQHGEWYAPIDPNDEKDILSVTRFWAAGASQTELKAAAMVAVEKMAPRSRSGFIGWLRKKGLL
jgi:hypothetical protein